MEAFALAFIDGENECLLHECRSEQNQESLFAYGEILQSQQTLPYIVLIFFERVT